MLDNEEILCPDCLQDISDGPDHNCDGDEIGFYNIGGQR